MRKQLRLVHRWLGYPLGLIFLLTLLTGIITGIEDYVQNQRSYGQSYVALSANEVAISLAKLHTAHSGYRQIQLPTPASPVFIVSMRGEKIVYTAQTLEQITRIGGTQNAIFSYVLRLHRNLALGRNGPLGLGGDEWVAWIGLLSAGIALLGVYLWWPLRKSFKLKNLVPSNNKGSSYFLSHLTGGIVCVLFLLLFALTGAAITYRSVAQALMLSEQSTQQAILNEQDSATQPAPVYTGKPWYFAVNYLAQQQPQAVLKSIAPARGNATTAAWLDGSVQLRYHSAQDWLGLAGSALFVDRDSGAILAQQAFKDFSVGEKLYRMIVPLHTGRGVTSNYLLAMLLIMTLLLVVVIAGLTSFVRRKSKLNKKLEQIPSIKGWIS